MERKDGKETVYAIGCVCVCVLAQCVLSQHVSTPAVLYVVTG